MQLSDYAHIVKTKYSNRFIIYRYDSTISVSLYMYGEYQQVEIDLLLQLIDENTVVYDIGGNIGYHASAFASKSKNVHSFEANPQHYNLLRMNLQDNPRCNFYNVAISDTNGTIKVETINTTEINNYGEAKVGTDEGVEVQMFSIDTLVEKGEIPPPAVMKIDVEGHEPNVFRGAQKTISKYQPVIYFEAQESKNTPEVYKFLTDLKYSLGWCVVRNYNPENFNKNTDNHFGNHAIFSIIAFPEGNPNVWPIPVQGPDDTWEKLLARQEK